MDLDLAVGAGSVRVAVSSDAAIVRERRGPEPRRRWTVRARDLRLRQIWLVIAVHEPSRTVTLHVPGPAVLAPIDLLRLQNRLGEALARVLADGGDFGIPD